MGLETVPLNAARYELSAPPEAKNDARTVRFQSRGLSPERTALIKVRGSSSNIVQRMLEDLPHCRAALWQHSFRSLGSTVSRGSPRLAGSHPTISESREL